MERRERSTLIKNRIVQIVELGELDYDHEIEIVQFLADHLALSTLSQYAKDAGLSYNGAKKRKSKEMFVSMRGIDLICSHGVQRL